MTQSSGGEHPPMLVLAAAKGRLLDKLGRRRPPFGAESEMRRL
jgi:hypothetical protein